MYFIQIIKMKFTIFIIIILFSLSFADAQTSQFKIHFRKQQIVITNKGKSHTLNLNDKIDAAKMTSAEILFANRKDRFTYLVIDISGQSKIKQDNRQCGAGTESNFIWIKLNSTWKILDSNTVRYESCWSSISNDNYQKKTNSLSIEIQNFRDNQDIKLFYSSKEPEKGFQITQKPLEKPD